MPSLFSGAPLVNDGIATFTNTVGWLHSKQNASLGSTFSLSMLVQPDCSPDTTCMLADTRGGTGGRGVLLGLLPSGVHANCSAIPREQRSDCGETGIDEAACLAKGCCFETPWVSGPQCYTSPQNSSEAMRVYFYPAPGAPGSNLASFEVQRGAWSFIGASVTCASANKNSAAAQNCSVQFFVNGKASAPLNLVHPRNGDFGGAVLKLARFIGSFRAVATFPGRALSQAEHNAWANQFSQNVSLPLLSPAAAVSPTPQLLLDPANVSNSASWQSSAPPAADAVQSADSGRAMVLCGQGSAGVDIPFLSGAAGEMLHASFRFRLSTWPNSAPGAAATAAGQKVVVLTIGDSRHPLRIIVSDGQVYATSLNVADVLLGTTSGEWQLVTLVLATVTGEATVALDGAEKRLLLGAIQSVWMYLGQGYRTNDPNAYSRVECAEIDLTTMDISVDMQGVSRLKPDELKVRSGDSVDASDSGT